MVVLGALPGLAAARTRVSVGIGLGMPVYYGYPAYYGPRYYAPAYEYVPDYAPAPVVVTPAPAIVGAAPTGGWYYCDSARAYYPYVSSCPEGWREVPSTAPAAR